MWEIRGRLKIAPYDEYENFPTVCSFKIHHDGVFTKFPNRKYINGKVDYVDHIDCDRLSAHEIDEMMEILGYGVEEKMWYHYRIPGKDLDFGLRSLSSDNDVIGLIPYITNSKEIDVFTEHGKTKLWDVLVSPSKVSIEELRDEYIPQPRRLQICWTHEDVECDTSLPHNQALIPSSIPHSLFSVWLRYVKKGFKACMRDLLGLDGCFMKGPFPGQVLTAVGVDPNNGIYPLAYGVVESESTASWTWFLKCLGDDLDLACNSNFTFISDRQKGIIPAIAAVFPSAEHRYCLRHMHENMKLQWKGKGFKDHMWKCATACTIPYFEKAMDDFKHYNSKAYEWLKKYHPHHWSRSHFSGRSKCDVLLNNMCEVFNRQLLDARDKPIISCLEYIREYLMRRIVNVQKVIVKAEGLLTTAATKLFNNIKKEASQCKALWNGGQLYQVSAPWMEQHIVDVQQKSCSCRRWELTGMPCKHAVATFWLMLANQDIDGHPESWVDKCYWLETWNNAYAFKVNPINGRLMWPKSECPTKLTPPLHHPQIGRPKKKRKKAVDELPGPLVKGSKLAKIGKTVTCNKCKNRGHNARTCKGQGSSS